MSANLSFTQELRRLGLIADSNNSINDTPQTVDTNTIKSEEDNTKDDVQYSYPNNDDSIIYIGKKPAMNYVLTINSKMMEGMEKVTVKSRGKNISKAVDVAEILTNRFVPEANDDKVKLSTEEIFRKDGTSINVSTIEIIIQK